MIKKITFYLMATGLLLIFQMPLSNAAFATKSCSVVVSNTKESAEVIGLVQRVNEIKAMDLSNLNPSDRTNIRNELISISHRLQDRYFNHGVYISVGGLLIVLIILILILR